MLGLLFRFLFVCLVCLALFLILLCLAPLLLQTLLSKSAQIGRTCLFFVFSFRPRKLRSLCFHTQEGSNSCNVLAGQTRTSLSQMVTAHTYIIIIV
jgi:hypothetical protein